MPETVPISGKAILDAVPGNVLLIYAIEKLLREGKTRHEITDICISRNFKRGGRE